MVNSLYYQSDRPEMAGFLPEKYSHVLEIGCGEGCFTRHLAASCEVWGVEMHNGAAAEAAEKMFKVIPGDYRQVAGQLPDRYFDLVVCNDVIEHMHDHDWCLESIKTKMAPGASLVGSIPNVRYFPLLFQLLIRKDWNYEEAGILDRTHLRFFTEKSLKRTLNQHGFVIEKFRGMRSPVREPLSLKTIMASIMIWAIIVASLGFCRDVRILQYGFQARLAS